MGQLAVGAKNDDFCVDTGGGTHSIAIQSESTQQIPIGTQLLIPGAGCASDSGVGVGVDPRITRRRLEKQSSSCGEKS
jgi:hypothetical protein